MNIDNQLLSVIEGLDWALEEYKDAIDDPTKGYAFYTGYSRASIETAKLKLLTIVENYRSLTQEEMD
mgnify:CR=1 FL=1|tara:strand:- start:292 stop:492 length:201 start_codon:yes stop_codon:yes gene_type:complete